MRPDPDGSVNSESLMPILRRMHSTWSTEPVAMAILGISPCVWSDGITVFVGSAGVLVQAVVAGTTSCRRQRPETMTSGMLAPAGTLSSSKLPLSSVTVPTSGEPEGGAPTTGQLTPGGNASTGALGM